MPILVPGGQTPEKTRLGHKTDPRTENNAPRPKVCRRTFFSYFQIFCAGYIIYYVFGSMWIAPIRDYWLKIPLRGRARFRIVRDYAPPDRH